MWQVIKVWQGGQNVYSQSWNCPPDEVQALCVGELTHVLESLMKDGWEPFSVQAGDFYLKKYLDTDRGLQRC